MYTTHAGYSFVGAIQPEDQKKVSQLLLELNSTEGTDPRLPFSKCKTTLFVSGFVVASQDYHGEILPPTLILMTTYSGSKEIHLKELVEHCSVGLTNLLQYCKNANKYNLANKEELLKFLKKSDHHDTFYSGIQYITHDQIGRENELRDFIESHLDLDQGLGQYNTLTPKEIHRRIQLAVLKDGRFGWAQKLWKRTFADYWALYGALYRLIFYSIATLVAMSIIIHFIFDINIGGSIGITLTIWVILFAFLIISFRLNELKPHFVAPRQPDEHVRQIFANQMSPVINKMTVGAPLKKGWIRPVFLFIVLRLAHALRAFLYIPTVASARWLPIDNGRRLIFNSNFGNLSESYVRDFIDSKKRARNINLIYGQGIGYPLTKWARQEGAITNPEGFINDVHLMDHPVLLWYWPYQNLSVENIINNRKISLGLFSKLDDLQIIEWLKLL